MAIFLTKGAGYYEQYKAGEAFAKYGLPDYNVGGSTNTKTDLIRQLWLDNDFYGSIFSLQYHKNKTQLTIGGGCNEYDGKHFGIINWAKLQPSVPSNYQWYHHTALKKDLSLYAKWTQQINLHWQSFIDLQYRNVDYNINGFRDNPGLLIDEKYGFLNPKAGITYNYKNWQAFLSYAMSTKEPNRDDFEAGSSLQPKAEKLRDIELGIERKRGKISYGANFYYMQYKDQLVLTGKINDVGAYSRINIPQSYRAGVEIQTNLTLTKWLNMGANISFSENKVNNFTEYIDDYDNGGQISNFYKKTSLSFSPAVVAGSSVNLILFKNGELSLINKYVSRQFLDNTEKISRSLHPYYLQDVRVSYLLQSRLLKEVRFIAQFNNVFNQRYEANGYTFSYVYGGLTTENYYFPMAPFNCMFAVNIKI